MDRLINLEPSNLITIRIEPGQKSSGKLTLRNVMHTMPVAFRLQPANRARYTIRPQSGIISPLTTLTLEITYQHLQNSNLPDMFPHSDDSFLLHSVVVPGAGVKDPSSALDSVPNDWFTTIKKQVFVDSGIRVMFLGSHVLAQLVSNGSLDQIREVLEKSDPAWKAADSVDTNGNTLLHMAVAQGRPNLVQLILEFDPSLEAQNQSGTSPLETAAASGEALIVELLLAHGATTKRSESSTWGPIHLAAGGGHVEVLKLLLIKKADVNSITIDGNTALHLAAEQRRRDCARLLLAGGAQPDICNNGDGDTALHISAALGDEQMVKLLLQKGAIKDIRNRFGKTSYDVAAEHGNTKLFDELHLGESLSSAARKGEVRKIKKLIENGAAVNGRDLNGWTALHRASFKGWLEAARELIEKGVDINGRDDDGYTALHCAVESGYSDVIELLVKKGADVEAETNKGVTALQIAESLNYSGITRILVHGRDTKDGRSQISVTKMDSLFSKRGVGEMEIGSIGKKIGRRARVLRSSFDRSAPLAVSN